MTWQNDPLEAPPLRAIPVEEAVGCHFLHDMTEIIPGKGKRPAFRRGQIVCSEDLARLRRMGKESLFVQEHNELGDEWIHEDDFALATAAAMAGPGTRSRGVCSEGRVDVVAERAGLLLVDQARLREFNLVPQVMCATAAPFALVEAGTRLAGTRTIPIFLHRSRFTAAMQILKAAPLLQVQPLRAPQVGLLVTGNEVFQGTIEDRFTAIVTEKVQAFGGRIVARRVAPDSLERIGQAARELCGSGIDLLITTAGLSVDPDDVTFPALLSVGLTEPLKGMPVLPGAMTLLGRIGDIQVLGLPAGGLVHSTFSIDILLPRVLAGLKITREDLAELAAGGLLVTKGATP